MTVKSTGCRFHAHSRKSNIYISISSLWSAVEFHHSTRNASRIQNFEKWGTVCVNTRFPLPPDVCGIQRKADLIFFIKNISSKEFETLYYGNLIKNSDRIVLFEREQKIQHTFNAYQCSLFQLY